MAKERMYIQHDIPMTGKVLEPITPIQFRNRCLKLLESEPTLDGDTEAVTASYVRLLEDTLSTLGYGEGLSLMLCERQKMRFS
jgi:hypothetical protein